MSKKQQPTQIRVTLGGVTLDRLERAGLISPRKYLYVASTQVKGRYLVAFTAKQADILATHIAFALGLTDDITPEPWTVLVNGDLMDVFGQLDNALYALEAQGGVITSARCVHVHAAHAGEA